MGGSSESSQRLDEELLRYLGRILGDQQEVSRTSLFPANKQESLVVHLNADYYPEDIDAVRLELRVYTNGEFHVSYFETVPGEIRHCRWDRHEQEHSSRDHFHPLPDAFSTDAANADFPADVTTLLETVVLPWVKERLGTLWAADDGE